MNTVNSAAMAFLAVIAAVPAFAQESETFRGGICEIDTTPLNVPNYRTPDGTRSAFTFDVTKQCTGVASQRNMKLICITPLPDWKSGTKSATKFECTVNPDICGLPAKPGDKNFPFATTFDSSLKVQSGIATLTCLYKP